ncbi:MAG: carboxypeptidase M32 [Pseudomonadota bacterium]
MNQAYEDLLAHQKQTMALGRIGGLMSWDQEVMMPRKGADSRAEQSGALSAVMHDRRTDPRIGDWLDAIPTEGLTPTAAANIRLIRRSYDRTCLIPKALAEETAKVTTKAQITWAEARATNDVAAFAPTLRHVIDLTRQYADCLKANGSRYDALLDDYEPGATEAGIAGIFDRLRVGLVDLKTRISDSEHSPPKATGDFTEDAQMALARDLAGAFTYDWQAGRLDLSVHPFSSGTRGDARITTRVDPQNPFDCLYSTIHETGHALYEQGVAPDLDWQPAGQSVSMGVHESQSRFCENQIGRSAPFAEFLWPKFQEAFGNAGLGSADDLYRATNRVAPGFIRTEADEVHYNLHIMLRFDLERALIGDDLQVDDLEAAWNERFETDFGVAVPDPARGMLQDVHWSCGLFGYFPTYSLGNVYAGCLDKAMRGDLPDRDQMVSSGDLAPVVTWLREKVHRTGSLLAPGEVIAEATGAEPSEAALLDYLDAKFGAIYGL